MRPNIGIRHPSKSFSSSQSHSGRTFCRRLLACERLESRFALSSVTLLESDPCVTALTPTASEEPAAIADSGSSDLDAATGGVLIGPLESDAYYESLEGAAPTTVQPEGEAAIAPVIDHFAINVTLGYWLITGHVSDDQIGLPGHVVRFGGILAGHQTTPLPDGSFLYVAMLTPGTVGVATAVAIDNTGLISDEVNTIVS